MRKPKNLLELAPDQQYQMMLGEDVYNSKIPFSLSSWFYLPTYFIKNYITLCGEPTHLILRSISSSMCGHAYVKIKID